MAKQLFREWKCEKIGRLSKISTAQATFVS